MADHVDPAPPRKTTTYTLPYRLKLHLTLLGNGLSDALNFGKLVELLRDHHKLKFLFLRCILLNGVIFLGSMALARLVVIPAMHWILSLANQERAAAVFDSTFHLLFTIFWVLPVYILSFVLNTQFYQEIANETYTHMYDKPTEAYLSVRDMLSGEIYRMMVVIGYLVQVFVVGFIPRLGSLLAFLLFSYLYAYYSFEYLWSAQMWTFERRIRYIEKRWEYFLGFGLPCTAFSYFFPTFVSDGFYAIVFPVFIVLAAYATPGKLKEHHRALPARLHIFDVSTLFNRIVLGRLFGNRSPVPTPSTSTSTSTAPAAVDDADSATAKKDQ